MDSPVPEVASVIEAYHRCWIALRQTAEPVWAQLTLTSAQLKCLLMLEVRRTMTIGQIAELLTMSRSSASITIDQLVHLGLVQRSEDREDRRRTLVCPSREGHALAARLYQGDEELMRLRFERMGQADLEALRTGLTALAGVIELTGY